MKINKTLCVAFLFLSAILPLHSGLFSSNTVSLYDRIHDAIETGNLSVIQQILDQKSSEYAKQIIDEHCFLNSATQHNHIAIVKYFLNKKVDINGKNDSGNTALHVACHYGYLDIAQLLINSGADITIKNKMGNTPLHVACVAKEQGFEEEYKQIVHILITKGAPISEKNSQGNSPLHIACINNRTFLIDLLVVWGSADIESKNSNSKKPADLTKNLIIKSYFHNFFNYYNYRIVNNTPYQNVCATPDFLILAILNQNSDDIITIFKNRYHVHRENYAPTIETAKTLDFDYYINLVERLGKKYSHEPLLLLKQEYGTLTKKDLSKAPTSFIMRKNLSENFSKQHNYFSDVIILTQHH